MLVLAHTPSVDVGASQLIADGKIKLKNDSQIKEYTESGLLFEDGSELPADVIICATGYVSLILLFHRVRQVDYLQTQRR